MFKAALVLSLACTVNSILPSWPLGQAVVGSSINHMVVPQHFNHAFVNPVSAFSSDGLRKILVPKRSKMMHRDTLTYSYYISWKTVEKARRLIQEHIKFDEKPLINDHLRHYNVLLGVLYHIVENIASTCRPDKRMYEAIYLSLVDESLATAWNDPKAAADKINNLIDVAAERTEDIRLLIYHLCGKNKASPKQCDRILEGVLSNALEEYTQQAQLLVKLGKMAALFEDVASDLENVADNREEVSFLLDDSTKYFLEPLIMTAVGIVLELDIYSCGKEKIFSIPKSRDIGNDNDLIRLTKMPTMPEVPAMWG